MLLAVDVLLQSKSGKNFVPLSPPPQKKRKHLEISLNKQENTLGAAKYLMEQPKQPPLRYLSLELSNCCYCKIE